MDKVTYVAAVPLHLLHIYQVQYTLHAPTATEKQQDLTQLACL